MSLRSGGDKRGEKGLDLGKFVIARLRRSKKIAEMIVDPDAAWKAKRAIADEVRKRTLNGEKISTLTKEDINNMNDIDLNDIFEGFTVFEDVHKGDVYPENFLEEMFETSDTIEIAYQFLLDNETEWNWTKKQREEFSEQKKRRIIGILSRNSINPQTKKPHPPQRIEKAINESKYSIKINKTAEEQIKDVITAISAILPIRMENVEIAVKIPSSFAAKTYGTVEKYGAIKQSEWQNDGSWVGIMDLPAGLEAEFLDKINKTTHGRVQIKILKRT